MQFVLIISNGDEASVSDAEKEAAYADYAALTSMENWRT
jgi:hypothetical protein